MTGDRPVPRHGFTGPPRPDLRVATGQHRAPGDPDGRRAHLRAAGWASAGHAVTAFFAARGVGLILAWHPAASNRAILGLAVMSLPVILWGGLCIVLSWTNLDRAVALFPGPGTPLDAHLARAARIAEIETAADRWWHRALHAVWVTAALWAPILLACVGSLWVVPA